MDEQPRLTDLVPRRLPILALVMLAGLAIIAALEILYTWMPEFDAITSDGRVAAFDLDGEGSLAVWFSSVTLLAAAAVAVIVYFVRRHKTDDYQGRYRIWLAAAGCWLLMSIDETASLHEGFKELMAYLTGVRLLGDGSIWWVIPYFFLLSVVGSRLLLDMKSCRLSTAALVTAGGCYVLAVVAQLGWIMPESGARGVMLEEGAEMVGNLWVLLAMGLHARYVILDAEGLLPPRAPGANDTESPGQQTDQWVKIDSAHGTPQPLLRRKARSPLFEPEAVADPEPQVEESPVGRRLTKQEKKALRKRLMRERMERERKRHSAWNK